MFMCVLPNGTRFVTDNEDECQSHSEVNKHKPFFLFSFFFFFFFFNHSLTLSTLSVLSIVLELSAAGRPLAEVSVFTLGLKEVWILLYHLTSVYPLFLFLIFFSQLHMEIVSPREESTPIFSPSRTPFV